MPNDRRHVDPEGVNLHRNFSGALRCVRVRQHAALSRPSRDFSHRLYRSRFVVRVHHRHQARVLIDSVDHVVRVHQPLLVDADQLVRQFPERRLRLQVLDHRRVLDRRRHNLRQSASGVLLQKPTHRAIDGEIIALASARSKRHLVARAPQHRARRFARGVDRFSTRRRERVSGRRVPEVFVQERRHGARDFGPYGRRGVVVQVHASLERRPGQALADAGVARARE